MKSRGGGGASRPPPQHPEQGAAGSLLTSRQWLCPRCVPRLPRGPGQGAAWGQATASRPASPHTCFSPPTSGAWLLRRGQHLPRFPAAVPAERSEPGGCGVGAAHSRAGAQRRRLRALSGGRDAGREGCSLGRRQEPREASGSLRPAPPCQPGPGEGGRVVAAGGGGGGGRGQRPKAPVGWREGGGCWAPWGRRVPGVRRGSGGAMHGEGGRDGGKEGGRASASSRLLLLCSLSPDCCCRFPPSQLPLPVSPRTPRALRRALLPCGSPPASSCIPLPPQSHPCPWQPPGWGHPRASPRGLAALLLPHPGLHPQFQGPWLGPETVPEHPGMVPSWSPSILA